MTKWIIATLLLLSWLGSSVAQEGFNLWLPSDRPSRFNHLSNASCGAINGGNCTMTFTYFVPFPDTPIGSIVVYACACSSTAAAQDCTPTSITNGVNLTKQTNSAATMQMSVNYVIWTVANIGESFTCIGSGGAADATAGVADIFFQPDINTPIDVTTTTASGSSTNPNPAAITLATDNVRIAVPCASAVLDAAVTAPTGLSAAKIGTGDDTGVDVTVAITNTLITARAASEDVANYTGWLTGSWVCASVAARQRQY